MCAILLSDDRADQPTQLFARSADMFNMNAAAIPRFTCNLANPAATLAAMEARIAPRCGPAAYARQLLDALEALGTHRRPSQDRLLAQTRTFQESGTADPDAFNRLVNGVFLDETVVLFEHAETFGVRWHGHPGARLFAPLNADTFGTGPTVDLRADPSTAQGARSETNWCVEAIVKDAQFTQAFGKDERDFIHEELLRLQIDRVLNIQLFKSTPSGHTMRIGALQCFALCLQEKYGSGMCQPRHVYGSFDPLDGVIAFILGQRLVGSGVGVFQAHRVAVPSTMLTLHDISHWRETNAADRIIRQMELFAICCAVPWLLTLSEPTPLEFAEGSYGGLSSWYDSLAGQVYNPLRHHHNYYTLRAGFQLLLRILANPSHFNPAWVLENSVQQQCIANARRALAALDAPQ